MERQKALGLLTAPGQPFELESVDVYGRRCRGFVHAPPTLRDLYRDARSELPFIVYEDECITFAQAWDRAAQIADFLRRECGVRQGDRVAISMRNYPEWILCFMAATSVGCVAVALNSFWGPDEMAYGLRDSGSRVLFADGERLALKKGSGWINRGKLNLTPFLPFPFLPPAILNSITLEKAHARRFRPPFPESRQTRSGP